MADNDDSSTLRKHAAPLRRRALQGAGLAAIMTVFTLAVALEESRIAIPWMLFLLVVMPAGGAVGGVAFYVTDPLRYQGGWRKTVANVLSLLIYCFAVLAAFIVGANGPD